MHRNARAFYYLHREITEEHFPLSPQVHIKEGDVVRVALVRQTGEGKTTSAERMQFLLASGGVLCGLEGMAFIWEECRTLLPAHVQVMSYAKPEVLWKAQEEDTRVPRLIIDAQGSVYFSLTRFEALFDKEDMFLLIVPVAGELALHDRVQQKALEDAAVP
jgi:hypothetical protein